MKIPRSLDQSIQKLRGIALWQTNSERTPIEHLVEYLLTGFLEQSRAPEGIEDLAREVVDFDCRETRVVILGGGTGLSTVVGGNSQSPSWSENPFIGLKEDFPDLHIVVCTTDDGGSTGRLLRTVPMMAIGDIRKSMISSVLAENLERTYRLPADDTPLLARALQLIFHHRFPEQNADAALLRNPSSLLPPDLHRIVPETLASSLRGLGAFASDELGLEVVGHCLGNLLLTSAIFSSAQGCTGRPPSGEEVQTGLDSIARVVGANPGRIHAATSTPGQLRLRYANGVEVYGQNKSAGARRGFPVDRVLAEMSEEPLVSSDVIQAIRDADLIIYAPGSLYTSIIPILQLKPIEAAIRRNTRALKILGANSWVQEGETDISLRNQARGFLVSELIEAYDRNVPGGVEGLFDIVLSANLEHVPGNILRNYALEGKTPIHLDRSRVERMGFQPVEATLFSPEFGPGSRMIHHDARRFTLAIRALLYARNFLNGEPSRPVRAKTESETAPRPSASASPRDRGSLLCDYVRCIRQVLVQKQFEPESLRETLLELAWSNRDIRKRHLQFFDSVRVVPPSDWARSTEWDNVLGYYDPDTRSIRLHQDLLTNHQKLYGDLLVAIGESLLGRYIESRHWEEVKNSGKCYQIRLRQQDQRECFLSDEQLRMYLRLARMREDPDDPSVYSLNINAHEGFLPPGLLFGLTYAWYLDNHYGNPMEYEMSLLRWPADSLIPYHAEEQLRKRALVTFFRQEVFDHGE